MRVLCVEVEKKNQAHLIPFRPGAGIFPPAERRTSIAGNGRNQNNVGMAELNHLCPPFTYHTAQLPNHLPGSWRYVPLLSSARSWRKGAPWSALAAPEKLDGNGGNYKAGERTGLKVTTFSTLPTIPS